MKLSPIQEKIVETPGNLIVRASAGTGKTHTMVNKIAKEIDDNHTHKVIAAITFTIKAAQEIKDRLSVDVVQHFIGTNNSFVIEEVIKPFMKDVYGADFDLDMSTDYSAKVDTFQEAIEKILWFINCGDESKQEKQPKMMDWEQDFHLIVSPINRVLGVEIIKGTLFLIWLKKL